MMGVFSELERNIITERIRSGLINARINGRVGGRPKTTADDIPELFYKYYPQYKNGNINKSEFARLSKISYPSVYKYLRIVEDKNNKGRIY